MPNIISRRGLHDQGERCQAILAALKSGPKTRREISDLSGFHREGLRAHLVSLMDDGLILRIDESLEHTVYRLASRGETSIILDRNRLLPGERQRQILEHVKEAGILTAGMISANCKVGATSRKLALRALRKAGELEFEKSWCGPTLYTPAPQ